MRCIKRMWIGGMVAVLVVLGAGAVHSQGPSQPERAVITVENAHQLTEVGRWGQGNLSDLNFLPDSSGVLVGSRERATVYPLAGETAPVAYPTTTEAGFVLDTRSFNAQRVAYINEQGVVSVRQRLTGAEDYRFQAEVDANFVRLANDGRILLADDGQVWDAALGQALDLGAPLEDMTIAEDGQLAVGLDTEQALVWSLPVGTLVAQWALPTVDRVRFTSLSGERLLLVTRDNLYVVDVLTGAVVFEIPFDSFVSPTTPPALDASGRLLAILTSDGLWNESARITITDIDTQREILSLEEPDVYDMQFSPDGRYLLVVEAGAHGRVIRLDDGALVWSMDDFESRLLDVAFSPDGNILLTASWAGVRWWDLVSGASHWISPRFNFGMSVGFNPTTGSATMLVANRLIGLDPATGEVLNETTLPSFGWFGDYGAVSNDSAWVALLTPEGQLTLNNHALTTTHRVTAPRGTLQLGFSPNRQWLAAAPDFRSDTIVIETVTGRELYTLDARAQHMEWSADSRYLVLVSGGVFTALDMQGDGVPTTYLGHDSVWSFTVGAPALLAVPTASDTLDIYDLTTHSVVQRLSMPPTDYLAVAFSPDGTLVAAGLVTGDIMIWSVQTGQQLATLHGHQQFITTLRFNPTGTLLVSGGDDARVLIWGLP